jgi:hypothetical protein
VGVSEKDAPGKARTGDFAAAGTKAVVRALLLSAWVLAAGTGLAQEPPAQPPSALAAPAGEPATPRAWQSLSPQQQQLLQNFHDRWDSLPAEKQQSLARGSQRWINMSPEQRSGAQERFKQWRALPPEQRQVIRQRWQQFKARRAASAVAADDAAAAPWIHAAAGPAGRRVPSTAPGRAS